MASCADDAGQSRAVRRHKCSTEEDDRFSAPGAIVALAPLGSRGREIGAGAGAANAADGELRPPAGSAPGLHLRVGRES